MVSGRFARELSCGLSCSIELHQESFHCHQLEEELDDECQCWYFQNGSGLSCRSPDSWCTRFSVVNASLKSERSLTSPIFPAMRVALEEVSEAAGNPVQLERGWKLFLLLTRMLLHRPPRGGLISKSKLSERFDKFARGEWMQLIRASIQCDEQAAVGRRRKGR